MVWKVTGGWFLLTTVVAVRKGGQVEFGCDSQVSWGGRAHHGVAKVVANGCVTFGFAGSSRILDIMEFMLIPVRAVGVSDREWIISVFVPAVLRAVKEVDAPRVKDGQVDLEGRVILFVGDTLGYLAGNLSFVGEPSGVLGVGSGADFALGALAAGASVTRAVEIARELDMYTGGDVTTMKVGSGGVGSV